MKKNKKAGNAMLSSISDLLIAGDERIELPPKVLETPIIPFDQSPTLSYLQNHIHVDICNQIMTMRSLEIGHLMTSSFGVICSQMFNPVCKQPSVSKLTPFCFHSVLTAFSLVGQALTLLVAVSSMCYHTSTSALSTSSSSRGFTPFGWDISS